MIVQRLAKAGYTYGSTRAITPDGILWIVDAHRSDDPRWFLVRSDELLTAFLAFEQGTRMASFSV